MEYLLLGESIVVVLLFAALVWQGRAYAELKYTSKEELDAANVQLELEKVRSVREREAYIERIKDLKIAYDELKVKYMLVLGTKGATEVASTTKESTEPTAKESARKNKVKQSVRPTRQQSAGRSKSHSDDSAYYPNGEFYEDSTTDAFEVLLDLQNYEPNLPTEPESKYQAPDPSPFEYDSSRYNPAPEPSSSPSSSYGSSDSYSSRDSGHSSSDYSSSSSSSYDSGSSSSSSCDSGSSSCD